MFVGVSMAKLKANLAPLNDTEFHHSSCPIYGSYNVQPATVSCPLLFTSSCECFLYKPNDALLILEALLFTTSQHTYNKLDTIVHYLLLPSSLT